MTDSHRTRGPVPISASDRLNSWKEIAAYLSTSVRTVQRWERSEGLPVERHEHASQGTVYACRSAIDEWLSGRRNKARGREKGEAATPPAASGPHDLPRRLIVVPFRLLRADAEIEFLSLGVADAITMSLANVRTLIVRSPLAAVRYAGGSDPQRIARAADVDLVLVGTLLRAGGALRVGAQLVDGATGRVVCSRTVQGSLQDLFQLQDQIVRQVVESLAVPLSTGERDLLGHDVPASAEAFEHYLRANELAGNYTRVAEARDLYARSLEEDPNYAPAWARYGRCCRVVGKFAGDMESIRQAERALRRALELNPGLAAAHCQLAFLEADSGRAVQGMVRLLRQAETNRNSAELFAGLVHICRFCGLIEASIAAHEYAVRLAPGIRTSVSHTFFMCGLYDRALTAGNEIRDFLGPLALAAMGRKEEALALCREHRPGAAEALPLGECMILSVRLVLEGRRDEALQACESAIGSIAQGPEEMFYQARHLAYMGEGARSIEILRRAVEEGYYCYTALACDPWLDTARRLPECGAILEAAAEKHREAARAFIEAGGEKLLGAV